MPTHYEILNIARDADEKTIKKAYHARALETHPDKHPEKIEEFKVVGNAYETLSDPEKKAVYDATLPRIEARTPTPTSPGSPSVGPNQSFELGDDSSKKAAEAAAKKEAAEKKAAEAAEKKEAEAKKAEAAKAAEQARKVEEARKAAAAVKKAAIPILQSDFVKLDFSKLSQYDALTNVSFSGLNNKQWIAKADEILEKLSEKYATLRDQGCRFFPKGAHFLENALSYAEKNLGVPKNKELNDMQRLWIVLKYTAAKPNDRTAKALGAVISDHATPATSQVPSHRS